MKSGIYKISTPTKFYFGSSIDIPKRWVVHRSQLRLGKHGNPMMQRSWDKYGEAAFTFEVVELCSPEETLKVEQRYLDFCVGLPDCMNISVTASGPMTGRKHTGDTKALMSRQRKGKRKSAETRRRMSKAKGKPVGVFDTDGTLLDSWPSTLACSQALGCSFALVARWCRGGTQPGQGSGWSQGISLHIKTHTPGIEFHYLDK